MVKLHADAGKRYPGKMEPNMDTRPFSPPVNTYIIRSAVAFACMDGIPYKSGVIGTFLLVNPWFPIWLRNTLYTSESADTSFSKSVFLFFSFFFYCSFSLSTEAESLPYLPVFLTVATRLYREVISRSCPQLHLAFRFGTISPRMHFSIGSIQPDCS